MSEPETIAHKDIIPPKHDRIGNDNHEGPKPNPGGTVDTGDALIPPYDERTKGESMGREDDTPAQGTPPVESHKAALVQSPALRVHCAPVHRPHLRCCCIYYSLRRMLV